MAFGDFSHSAEAANPNSIQRKHWIKYGELPADGKPKPSHWFTIIAGPVSLGWLNRTIVRWASVAPRAKDSWHARLLQRLYARVAHLAGPREDFKVDCPLGSLQSLLKSLSTILSRLATAWFEIFSSLLVTRKSVLSWVGVVSDGLPEHYH